MMHWRSLIVMTKETRKIGRPRKHVDIKELREIYERLGSYRRTAEEYNLPRRGRQRISHEQVRRILSKVLKHDDSEESGDLYQEASG